MLTFVYSALWIDAKQFWILRVYYFKLHFSTACENGISSAVTETKQAEMRLKSAQSELKEKEAGCKDSGHSYSQDKTKFDTIGKDIAKIEVHVYIQYHVVVRQNVLH